MAGKTDRTVELVKRSLDPETAPVFEKRLKRQAAWLREAIEDGRMDNDDFAVGLEMEVYAVTESDHDRSVTEGGGGTNGGSHGGTDGEFDGGADAPGGADETERMAALALAPLPESVFEEPAANKELGLHNVEINTDPTVLSEAGLAAQADGIRERTRTARRVARTHGCELALDAMWTLPPEEGATEYLSATERRDGVVFADNMRQDPRYVAIDNDVLEHAGGGPIPLSVPGASPSFPTILFESLATSIQPHLQIPTADAFPAYYNTAIRTLGPVLALSANSPFLPAALYDDIDDHEAFLEATHHELRIAVFEQSVNRTPNAKVRVPRDIETAADVVDRVLGDDRYAPFLREWIDGGTDRETLSERLWEFDHKRGTYWRWLRCVVGGDRIGPDNDERSLRIEYRPLPTQPTVTDVVGLQALVAGLLCGLVAADHPIVELPWEAAESSFYNAAESGLEADLEWVTETGERTNDRERIFGEVFSYARTGLEAAGVPASDIERYLAPIEARWDARKTPSDWKKARVGDALDAGADIETAITRMQTRYLDRSRETDSFAEWL